MNRVHIVGTGGTIEKAYNEHDGSNDFNKPSPIPDIIRTARLVDVSFISLFRIDSLFMNDDHRQQIAEYIANLHREIRSVVITHGTDTMIDTGLYLQEQAQRDGRVIAITGAMVPHSHERSDAVGNVAAAVAVAHTMPRPGNDTPNSIHLVMNGQVMSPDEAYEDPNTLFFSKIPTYGPPNLHKGYERSNRLMGGSHWSSYEHFLDERQRLIEARQNVEAELDAAYPPVFNIAEL